MRVSAVLFLVLMAGCAVREAAVPAGTAQAQAAASMIYYPVGVGVSYVMPLGHFQDTVGFELTYAQPLGAGSNWDVMLSLGAMRLTWSDSPATKSDHYPILLLARYSKYSLRGASFYGGFGVGYALNDPGDMSDSFVARVMLGTDQVLSERMMAGLEFNYTYSKADAKWGPYTTHDLSSVSLKLNLVFMLGL